MLSPLRTLTDIPAFILVALAVISTQGNVVHAQSNNNPYYIWLSPGRIAGIAIGAAGLILFLASVLIMTCRHHKRASVSPEVAAPPYPAAGPPPPAYPSQQQTQQSNGSPVADARWYSAQRPVPLGQPKPPSPVGAQMPIPPGQAPWNEGQGVLPLDRVQAPVPTSHPQGPTPSSQIPMPALASPAPRPTPMPTGQTRRRPSSRVQGSTSAGSVQSAVPSARVQERAAASPPRATHTQADSHATGPSHGREQSPPPYSAAPPSPPLQVTRDAR